MSHLWSEKFKKTPENLRNENTHKFSRSLSHGHLQTTSSFMYPQYGIQSRPFYQVLSMNVLKWDKNVFKGKNE